jgi:iron complex outermembrane receptor protein|tara:strand:+ start:61 stop:2058 length:1998 start_codon:yes stop_codon:yes gene_type:complete
MMKYFILTIFTLLSIGQLSAQDTLRNDSLHTLQEVVVTYQADKQTPITFQNIYSKDIKAKSTGQEPSFLLSETPSITNYSDAGNSQGYSYFRLRGIDQTRINMTLDGVPLNEPEDQGAYFSNYPDILNSVSKIQIQRGVGTSKNGVASYGGSIQLFSPNLADSTKTTFGLGYGSFNSLRVFGEYNSGIKNKKALYVRASQIYSDGYKYHSSNNSKSVFLSGGLFHDKSIWKLNFLAGHQQNYMAWIGVSDSLIDIDRRTNANSKQEKDRFLQTLTQLKNSWQIGQFSSLETSIYHTFLKGNYGFDFNNFLSLSSTDELYNYAFQSNLFGFFSNYTLSKKQFNLISGVHGNIYNRQHTGSEKTIGQLYQNTGYKNEISVFTKVDYSLKWFAFFADVQYRYVNFDYKGLVALQKLDWHFINPKAGLSATLNNNSILYYSVGYTGREPTRNDMFGGNDDLLADSLGNAILSNTNPEFVLNHELGFRFQKEKMNFNANLYYMDFQNEIVLDGKFGPNGLALTNNVEQSFRAGIELSLAYKVSKHFSLVNNSSFNYSRITEQTETFSPILTPPIIINQEVIFSKNKFTIALSGRYQQQSFIDFANEEKVNRYFLLNSRASYNINDFQFSVFLNNITNTKYFNQGYVDFDGSNKYFVQAPTNFYASIQYSF